MQGSTRQSASKAATAASLVARAAPSEAKTAPRVLRLPWIPGGGLLSLQPSAVCCHTEERVPPKAGCGGVAFRPFSSLSGPSSLDMRRAKAPWGASMVRCAVSCRQYWRTVGQPEGIVSEQDTDHHFVHRSTIPTMHFQPSLPRFLCRSPSFMEIGGRGRGEGVSGLRVHRKHPSFSLSRHSCSVAGSLGYRGKAVGCRISHTLFVNVTQTVLFKLLGLFQKQHPVAVGAEQLRSEFDRGLR